MAESAVTAVLSHKWDDSKRIHVLGALTIGASPGTYTTGGIALNFLTLITDTRQGFVPLPGITKQPQYVNVQGIAGYFYQYDYVNKKLLIRSVGQATFTVKNGTIGSNMTIGLSADSSAANLVGGTGITADRNLTTNNPIGAQTIAEITGSAAMPAGVSGDTIQYYVIFAKNQ